MFNHAKIDVRVDYARIELYDYEPIEGRSTLLFSCIVRQPDGSGTPLVEPEFADKLMPRCNDLLLNLMRHANSMWPLGKWSIQRGYGWKYLSTREEEVAMLYELAQKYYGRKS